MKHEADVDGSSHGTVSSVLRPFEAPEQAPLPPVEPSQVVAPPPPPVAQEPVDEVADPVDEIAEVFDEIANPVDEIAEVFDEVEEVAEPVEDTPLPAPPPVEALEDDPWSPEAIEAADVATDVSEGGADDDAPADAPMSSPVFTTPAATTSDTITMPRKTFLIGLAVMFGAVALLAILWQTGGGDDPVETVTPPITPDPVSAPVDAAPIADSSSNDGVIDELNTELVEARATVAGLEAEVADLLERPAPALPGEMMRRIVVSADAKFVSAREGSVAVVGAFGGVSMIDPATNRVIASGNVANGATRVMRTARSVWITNYTDNQLIQMDPATNTVVAAFPFPGPDGIEKDGDTLVVASFDGGLVARVKPDDGTILQQVDVGGKPTDVLSHPDHGLWAAVFDTGELVQIDRVTFEIIQRVTVGQGPVGISADASHLWVANHDEGTIVKLDPATGEVLNTVIVGDGPTELVVINGSVWVTVTDEGSLVQVNAGDGRIVTRTPLGGARAGGGPTGISTSEGVLWVAMQGEQSVVRVDL